jgi:hypothetical protein
MAEQILVERALNRALLARQLLLERSNLPIASALEQIAGIQNQYAPNAYIRLRSCLERFERDDLTHALERRAVVQGTLMRSTIHTVSAMDYWGLAIGVRRARREWALRHVTGSVSPREMERQALAVRSALIKGPLRGRDLSKLASRDVGIWLDMVRIPPSGTWERRRADLYQLAETWLGKANVTEWQGLELLVRRYLGGFGPASAGDIASWSGVTTDVLTPVIESLNLRHF